MRPKYATEADWPEVETLLSRSSLFVEGIHERITQYFVARDNAGLLGCVGIEEYGATGVLSVLVVAERARSAGLGELLIAAIVTDLRLRGVESIVLWTKTAADYFTRLGFTPISAADLPQSARSARELDWNRDGVGTLMQTTL